MAGDPAIKYDYNSMREEVQKLLTLARKLDVHYSDVRYPTSVGGSPHEFHDKAIAQELLDAAKELVAYAKKGLSESD